jgi:predicted ester cyclase
MLFAMYIVHGIEKLQKAFRFLVSHACRVACKLLFNKQFNGKAQNRPIRDKHLIPCAPLIAIRWNPEQITLLQKC